MNELYQELSAINPPQTHVSFEESLIVETEDGRTDTVSQGAFTNLPVRQPRLSRTFCRSHLALNHFVEGVFNVENELRKHREGKASDMASQGHGRHTKFNEFNLNQRKKKVQKEHPANPLINKVSAFET